MRITAITSKTCYFMFAALILSSVVTSATAATEIISTPGGDLRVPVTSYQEARFQNVIKQEKDFSCGSAAVATLLSYHYEISVTEQDVFALMFKNGDQQQIKHDGFSLLDMKRYLEVKGLRADGFRLPLDKLAEIGVPAITLINDDGYRHFVVIKGITARHVLLADPARGTRAMARHRFEKMWNGISFIIRNKRQIAATHFNNPEEWRMAALSPLHTVVPRDSVATFLLSLPGPYEF